MLQRLPSDDKLFGTVEVGAGPVDADAFAVGKPTTASALSIASGGNGPSETTLPRFQRGAKVRINAASYAPNG